MIEILFICHGNICRSTMAQYVFQSATAISAAALWPSMFSSTWSIRMA